MEHALRRQLGKKTKAHRAEPRRARGGRQVRRRAPREARSRTGSSRHDKTAGMILVEGNVAGALGCMMAGVTVVAWYPITPSSSLPEALIGFMKKYRIDKETGKATYAIVQAEDEIAAIGMVVGAGVGRRTGDDLDLRPGHLADERVRRPAPTTPRCRASSGTSSGSGRRPACRPGPRRATSSRPRCSRTATRGTSCCCRRRRRSATRWPWRRSISPSASRRWSS